VRNPVTKLLLGAAPVAGLALTLGSAAPVHAQFFFDIFAPPQQQHYSAPERERVRVYEHRRHHRAARHRRRRHAARHDDTWNPKEVKGPFQIVIATGPQEALLYGQNGLIARASISTGRPDKPTPKGVFTVISKARWHRSNIYSGAPMPWMQRITWSGVAMHEGPRPGYPASHGCIRLPGDFAVRLYRTTKVGARVVVTRDAVVPVPIVSDKLFQPAQPEEKPAGEMKSLVKLVKVTAAGDAAAPTTLAAKSSSTNSSAAKSRGTAEASGVDETTADRKDPKPAADPPAAGPPVTEAIAPEKVALPPPVPADKPKGSGPVSVFVSLKQGKVFVRRGFLELFDMPAVVADPDRPIGTHIYTAMGLSDDGKTMRWTALSIPSGFRHHHRKSRRHRHKEAKAEQANLAPSNAADALQRITLPADAVKRISRLLIPGSSLIVSDNALSDEVDDSTNFIVLTP
jgi:hypothetical protein